MYHRPFLRTALTFVLLGSLLGVSMLANLAGWSPRAWSLDSEAHAQMQVYGFVVLFTMGVAHQMLAQVFGKVRGTFWMRFSLVTMAAGTGLGVLRPAWHGAAWPAALLQLLGTLAFLASMMSNRTASGERLATPVHAHFMRWATIWLILSCVVRLGDGHAPLALELTLWGFATLSILGVGLRMHPDMLGCKPVSDGRQWLILLAWNAGLGLSLLAGWRAAGDAAWLLAALTLHLSLRPSRGGKGWLPRFLAMAYGWWLIAVAMRCGQDVEGPSWAMDAAIRHALASGFILSMMTGMAFRLVPTFEQKDLAWPGAPWACLTLLGLGTPLRVMGQAWLGELPWAGSLALGGGVLQAASVILFVGSLLDLLLRRGAGLRESWS